MEITKPWGRRNRKTGRWVADQRPALVDHGPCPVALDEETLEDRREKEAGLNAGSEDRVHDGCRIAGRKMDTSGP